MKMLQYGAGIAIVLGMIGCSEKMDEAEQIRTPRTP
jgi:hypothetical protein